MVMLSAAKLKPVGSTEMIADALPQRNLERRIGTWCATEAGRDRGGVQGKPHPRARGAESFGFRGAGHSPPQSGLLCFGPIERGCERTDGIPRGPGTSAGRLGNRFAG